MPIIVMWPVDAVYFHQKFKFILTSVEIHSNNDPLLHPNKDAPVYYSKEKLLFFFI